MAIEEIERAVKNVIDEASVTISIVPSTPEFPATQPSLKYKMTPKIVRTLGTKTPLKVPNLGSLRTVLQFVL